MTGEKAIFILMNSNEYHHAKGDLPHSALSVEAFNMAIEALKERPHEKWEYLKEHITEMRDADGKLNQKQTCQFILNLMGVIEGEGEASEQ